MRGAAAHSLGGSIASMARAAAKVTTALTRMELGNLSNTRTLGAGVLDIGSTSDRATGSTSVEMARH